MIRKAAAIGLLAALHWCADHSITYRIPTLGRAAMRYPDICYRLGSASVSHSDSASSRVRGANVRLLRPDVFRCVPPNRGNGPNSWWIFNFVGILVGKRLALRIPCHPNLLRLW
jgi:hypothetical protein